MQVETLKLYITLLLHTCSPYVIKTNKQTNKQTNKHTLCWSTRAKHKGL